ncbi:DUF418 domain-containing protein [Thalassobius sp. Cn5-15]|uniref:DUF418 domain-containing protein n=1 Tax=Thalassobius sp. Cn5-15 TaxID=2917763 RepID=UPI001EF34C2F|nr:DUF418 domain-containing protein [Thalassobius sp. Cn5-15]MCG7492977.1 DUF418 domain-containing protein [Thalassobius sp. Cn5-15]
MRLDGLDIARFLAFVGMVLVNFRIAAEVTSAGDVSSTIIDLLEGRAAALFVVLAGIGLGLSRAGATLVSRRALFLIILGMINVTIFDADILHYYGTYFLCVLPLLAAPARTLWAAAVIVTLIAYGGLIFGHYDAGWDWATLVYADFWTAKGYLRHTFYNGWHPVLPWVSFLLIGMALSRLDLASPAVRLRMALYGTLACTLGLIPAMLTTDPTLIELLRTAPIPPTPFYILSATGSACMAIAACLWAGPALMRNPVTQTLSLAGRQSLTLYLAHILIGMGTMEACGLLNGSLSNSAVLLISLSFCTACLIYANLWQHVAKRGPLEALMRKIAG